MSTSKERARAQQGPRTSTKKAAKLTPAAEKKTVRSAFHQPTGRDYVKKMTIEIDRDLHAELKVIAAQKGVTIREIVSTYLEEYVHTSTTINKGLQSYSNTGLQSLYYCIAVSLLLWIIRHRMSKSAHAIFT